MFKEVQLKKCLLTEINYIYQGSLSEGRLKYDLGQVINIIFVNKQIFHQEYNYLKILFVSILRTCFDGKFTTFILLSLTILYVFGYIKKCTSDIVGL
ncbi:MAG: hypothetical protein MPEBLZ_04434 [Candidatus Methanoperedens nitroreducens]|uniref:Uncharacterized protein n=1 Tax=Candidatus Methanoperedens nitratireducens TaxID=1392998 RepID=A0A0N8KQ32_9EURY|nr:MAG: hypothetical protein MPEBLZ_04434 [Candidatus Methanoperedens sp. BLZ1]